MKLKYIFMFLIINSLNFGSTGTTESATSSSGSRTESDGSSNQVPSFMQRKSYSDNPQDAQRLEAILDILTAEARSSATTPTSGKRLAQINDLLQKHQVRRCTSDETTDSGSILPSFSPDQQSNPRTLSAEQLLKELSARLSAVKRVFSSETTTESRVRDNLLLSESPNGNSAEGSDEEINLRFQQMTVKEAATALQRTRRAGIIYHKAQKNVNEALAAQRQPNTESSDTESESE